MLIPPIPGTGNGIGVGGMSKAEVKEARKGRYVLRFEDDDVTSQEVGAGFVVEVSVCREDGRKSGES